MTYDGFAADDHTRDAVIRNIEIVGEAAKRLPDEVIALAPEVPWRKVRGMREVIAHGYLGLDSKLVWDKGLIRITAGPATSRCVSAPSRTAAAAPAWPGRPAASARRTACGRRGFRRTSASTSPSGTEPTSDACCAPPTASASSHLLRRQLEHAPLQIERVARLHHPLGRVAAGRALRRPAAPCRALHRHACLSAA